MIGWNVDFYISDKYTKYGNVKEISFDDLKRPWGIFNLPNVFSLTPPSTGAANREFNNNFYNHLYEVIGDEVNRLYGCPTKSSYSNPTQSMIDEYKAQVPSTFLSFKNAWAKFVSIASSKVYGYMYIPSLKKLMIYWYQKEDAFSSRVEIYNVDDDGNILNKIYEDDRSGCNLTSVTSVTIESKMLGVDVFTSLDNVEKSNLRILQARYTIRENVKSVINVYIPTNVNQMLDNIFNWYKALVGENNKPDFIITSPDNPYEPGGPSGEGGGGGSFDKDSDLIPDSSLPSISAANTGFTRIYNPTLAQVQDLAHYLWTGDSVIETIWNHIKQYFESPMEAILGFNLVPVPVPNGGVEDFALMYIKTGVMMNTAANQFVDRDCGTFELKPYYGSALDYSPHTKVSCFLPYIGTVQLNTDEVMGKTLQVKYRVDICSGSCVAKIFVDGSCLYQYSGHCAINIPISASDFSSYVSSTISVAKLAIGAATGAGMAAAASVLSDPVQQTNQVVTRTTTTTETARNPLSGRQITTGTRSIVETTERPADVSSTQASFYGLTPSNISNTVGQIMGSKPHVEHSGSFSGNTGYLGVRRPFLIIERPNMCMPEQYQQFNGFPAMITMSLSECTGFTQVQQVQLTGMEATNPEQSEILQMLKTGVIL